MKKISFLIFCLIATVYGFTQTNNLSKGAELLFTNSKSKLSTTDKNLIFDSLDFKISKDGKQFILDDESADYPFDAVVYPTDLDKDGKEEIFIVFGNTYTSGNAGSSCVAFIANRNGKYKRNLGFPGLLPDAILAGNPGYPDLIIGGPGMELPVWKWNGAGYVYSKSITDSDYQKIKMKSLAEISKTYTSN